MHSSSATPVLSRVVAASPAALALLGLVDTFILVPIVLAPGTPLGGTYAAIAATGDLGWVLPWPVVWAILCAVILSGLRSWMLSARPSPTRVARLLLMLAAVGLLYLGAGIPLGLWISDHLAPYEGGAGPTGGSPVGDLTLFVVGIELLAAAALLVVAAARTLASGRRRRALF